MPGRRASIAYLVVFGGAALFLGGSWFISRYLRTRSGPVLVQPLVNRTGTPEQEETARRWTAALRAGVRAVNPQEYPLGAGLEGAVEAGPEGPRVVLRLKRGRRQLWSASYLPSAPPAIATTEALAALRRHSSSRD